MYRLSHALALGAMMLTSVGCLSGGNTCSATSNENGDAGARVIESDGGFNAPDCGAPLGGVATIEPDGTCSFICAAAFKRCGETCASIYQPDTGCGLVSCEPCAFDHATAMCAAAGECVPASCEPGWSDCDMSPANGCETHTAQDFFNCGACGVPCPFDMGFTVCKNGQCQ